MVLLLGLLDAVARTFAIFTDGISYIEIAEAYRKGNWREAINAYWSPLYSWCIAAWDSIVPFSVPELARLHALNFFIFFAAMAAFEFLVRGLLVRVEASGRRLFRTIAYLTFLWGALDLIGTWRPMPDLLGAALLFAACGLAIRVRRDGSARFAILFGVVLGLNYLCKAAMLPVALLFIAAMGPRRRAAVAALAFLAVAGPWVAVLSISKSRFTIGDSGAINYAWEVNGVRRWVNWQGDPDSGQPVHPTRQIRSSPELFEFSSPVPGMYPPWRDPSYWHEGLKQRFDFARQIHSVLINGRLVLALLLGCPAFLIPALLVMTNRERRRALARLWWLAAPLAACIGMYTLVFVEPRYVAPALVVVGLCASAAAFSIPASNRMRSWALAGAFIACAGFTAVPVLLDLGFLVKRVVSPAADYWGAHERTAAEMRSYGLRPGMRIGYMGRGIDAYWVRLCGARVICEIPFNPGREADLKSTVKDDHREFDAFWHGTAATRREVLETMHGLGADAVFAESVPTWAQADGWREIKAAFPQKYGTGRRLVYFFPNR